MRLNEIEFFGRWKAVYKQGDSWKELEVFDLTKDEIMQDAKRRLAAKYRLHPSEIVIYNMEEDPEGDIEEGIMNKINGGKRKIRRKVNVSQRKRHKLPHEKRVLSGQNDK